MSSLVVIVYLAAIAALAIVGKLPFFILYAILALSVIAFIAYARDKSAARAGAWRTPEVTLHVLALVGGWPGALAAQTMLRHKSAKRSFLIVFWITAMLNGAFVAWLLTNPLG